MRTQILRAAIAGVLAVGISGAFAAPAKETADALTFKLWLARAQEGDSNAQYIVGFRYVRGEGTPQNVTEAARWLRDAAEQGHPQAQWSLGTLYELGLGVPKDYAEAFRLYRLSAPKGVVEAQTNLGLYYLEGRGTAQDYDQAFRWLRVASLQGLAEAQSGLASMYEKGLSVPRDYVHAYLWFSLSADIGADGAEARRDRLGANMSRDDIERATDMARRCSESDFLQCD